jgi:hypothetical protein
VVWGQRVESTVRSCDTELQLAGRWLRQVTECEVTAKGPDERPLDLRVESTRPFPAGAALTLTVFRGSYADASLSSDSAWLIPLGLAVGATTWWLGFPSRVDLTYGKHAATRNRRLGR